MLHRQVLRITLTLCGWFAVVGTGAAAAPKQLDGSIIFASARGILELKLASREVVILVPSVTVTSFPTIRSGRPEMRDLPPTPMQIHHSIVPIDSDRFLFTERRQRDLIREFDRRTGAVRDVHAGHVEAYLPGVRQLLFFDMRSDREGLRLVAAELGRIEESRREVSPGPFATPTTLSLLSETEITFFEPRPKPGRLVIHDLAAGTQRDAPDHICRGAIVRTSVPRFLCFSASERMHYWTDQRNETLLVTGLPRSFAASLYIEPHKAYIGTVVRVTPAGEVYDIWMVDETSGASEILLERTFPFSPVYMR